jgi:hypothetical protein
MSVHVLWILLQLGLFTYSCIIHSLACSLVNVNCYLFVLNTINLIEEYFQFSSILTCNLMV